MIQDLFYLLLLAILVVNLSAFQRAVPTSPPSIPTEYAFEFGTQKKRSVYSQHAIPKQATDTSYPLSDVVVSTKKDKLVVSVKMLADAMVRRMPSAISTTREPSTDLLLKSWYALPMGLALVPLYCTFCAKTSARMPHWWPVTNIDHIVASGNGGPVIAWFIFSNIAYFASGSYLVKKFPPIKQGPWLHVPTRYTMLGVWVLAAGLVSTIFHSVQALGSFSMAEALCYVDHGVAISACFYYFETLPRPSRRVWALGFAGSVALVITHPGYYAWMHSTWHFLSAAGALLWALEGHASQNVASHHP
jgi:hypothetical protein